MKLLYFLGLLCTSVYCNESSPNEYNTYTPGYCTDIFTHESGNNNNKSGVFLNGGVNNETVDITTDEYSYSNETVDILNNNTTDAINDNNETAVVVGDIDFLYSQTSESSYDQERMVASIVEHLFDKTNFPKEKTIPMLNRKIFRGTRVSIREHPYIVSIRRRFSHYLTGTLLTKKLIMTVAHPIHEVPLNDLRAVVGENYNERGTTLLTIILIVEHEEFDPNTLNADIALLVIYEDVTFKVSVNPISLFPPHQSIDGQTAFVTGWGRCDRTGRELCLPRASKYFHNEIMDPMLRTVKFKINGTSCATDYFEKEWKYGMLCVGDRRKEVLFSPCLAVPGAPLVVDASLAGIQSWGFGCGYVDDRPLVYTSTAAFQPWLLHNVPILRNLTKNQLHPFFQASKALYVVRWLELTRVTLPKVQTPSVTELHPLEVDFELAKLKGNIIDIRDFIFNHAYKQKKIRMFNDLKLNWQHRQALKRHQSKGKGNLRVNPFMDTAALNATGLRINNGSLVETEGSNEDSSNEQSMSDNSTESNEYVDTIEMKYKSFYQTQAKPIIHF